MSSAKAKGDALEHAVHRIEEVLLENMPGLAGTRATIERNKRFPRGNAVHEVDLWVSLSPDTPFPSHHLIECKNWDAPVGQDVVMGVKTKRDLLGATKAIIIARAFTKAAIDTAAELGVTLTRVSDDFVSPLDAVQWVFTTHEPQDTSMSITFRDRVFTSNPVIDHERSWFRWGSRIGRLNALIWPQIEHYFAESSRSDPRGQLEGLHFGRAQFGYAFDREELFIDNAEIAHYTISLSYVVEIRHAKLDVKFNVDGHGGFHRLVPPPGLLGGNSLSVEIIAKPQSFTG